MSKYFEEEQREEEEVYTGSDAYEAEKKIKSKNAQLNIEARDKAIKKAVARARREIDKDEGFAWCLNPNEDFFKEFGGEATDLFYDYNGIKYSTKKVDNGVYTVSSYEVVGNKIYPNYSGSKKMETELTIHGHERKPDSVKLGYTIYKASKKELFENNFKSLHSSFGCYKLDRKHRLFNISYFWGL